MTPSDTPPIETHRFVLRRLVREDTATLFPTLSDVAQCLYMSQPAFETPGALEDWLVDPSWPGRSWVAVDRIDGAIAGRFVAFPGRDSGVAEVGYVTVLGRQGQGVATECMRALVTHLFVHDGFRKVYAEIDADNLASVALAERLGFVKEACLREHEITHKGLCDMLVYGVLRKDWPGVGMA